MARRNLLMTGIPMVKRLAQQTCPLNTVTKVPLLRMGIMTGVLLQFTINLTLSSGVGDAVTMSPVGPWNSIRRVSYTDFAGVKRTNTSGYQLWAAQNFKMGDAQGAIAQQPYVADPASSPSGNQALDYLQNEVLNLINIDDGVIASGNDATIYFSLYVPMAYDPSSDLTGAVLTQTNVGEHYIEIDIGNLLGTDLWYNAFSVSGGTATFTASSITVEPFQQYIQPQAMTADNLPVIDLSTIYGFEGAYETSSNIQSNMDTFINYPNNRSVLSALVNFQDNNTFDEVGSDLTSVILLANSNTNFKEMTPRYLKEMMRNLANYDAPGASYFFPSRRQPILTQLYANVQLKFGVGTLGGSGTTKFISQYEVQYASGAPLPGVTIAA
jgi:hypothetical protein